ncbi:MAG: thioredoxin domain-containing protein [Nitrospira sp.]|nr:thioredoxin domain-containing protein [Nitrospira sp.]MDI3464604.1 DSBA oxidoreductase [Nitrospira sp.]
MSKTSGTSLPAATVGPDDHVIGPATAVVTLIAYCDFECPYCGRAYPIIKRLRANREDRLRFVFRHFPLTHKHPHAQQAAEAAEAAGAQGQFWAMHDLLFENQEALGIADLRTYGEFLGLDMGRFDQALAAHTYTDRVQQDVNSGKMNGARGTPTFFINGARHTDEETLERVVLEAVGRMQRDT